MMHELPDNWQWNKLSDLAEINPKIPNKGNVSDNLEVQFLPMKLVDELSGKIHLIETKVYGEVKKGYTPFINGDIIFAKVTPCMENGKIAVVENLTNGIGFGSSEFHVIRSNNGLLNKYGFYYLTQQKFRSDAEHAMTGAVGLRRVPKQFLENSQLPIPPVEVQQQIVSKIEELFSELDKGIEELKAAQQQLKVYRQAVLKWAFEGKLTNEDVKDGELPEGWGHNKIGDVVKTIDGDRGPNYPKKHEFVEDGYCLFLSTKNVREDRFVFDEKIFITKEKDEKLRSGKLQLNDVVVTTRGTLGNVALYDQKVPFKNIRINSGMLILRPTDSRLYNYYLMKFITSPVFINQLKAKQTGTAQPQIPANILREIIIPIPSYEEQQLIVQEIESRLSVCDKLEETINASLEQAGALRQSILKTAFEGKLITSY